MTPPNGFRLKVAVAQTDTVFGDVEANLRRHLDVIEDARQRGVHLLLFPELSLVGHGAGTETLRVALRRDDPAIRRLAEAAGPMNTVFGFVEEGPAAVFYNSAALVRDGSLALVHRKVNLATYGRLEEGKHYGTGRRIETVEILPAWRAGLLICADLWNPALVHLSALHGATLMLAPISSAVEAVGDAFDNPGGWDTNLRFHAMTYGMPILMANRVGQEGDLSFWGGSRIVDPFGKTLAQAEGRAEQLVVAELDHALVRQARYLLPTVRDGNLAFLHRESERLLHLMGQSDSDRRL